MPSSKYHRRQARILAGLALSAGDSTKAEQFNLAALEHLERAQALDGADVAPEHQITQAMTANPPSE